MAGMENKGKGKGLGFFRRSKTPSSSSGGRATRSPSRDRHSDGPDLSGHIAPRPSAHKPKPPSPVRKAWNFMAGPRTKITAAKRVRPGIQFRFREPEPFPEHSPRDEDEDDDEDEDEVERDGAPDFGEDEPVELPSEGEGDDTDGMRDDEEEDEDSGPDESVPMVVEHTDRISRAPEEVPEEEPRPCQEKESGRREFYEEHLRAAREYPSEREMMREAMRRSHQQSYAPPPPPTVFYPSPPPHYQMYPQYPTYPPYQPYQPYQPYPQFPVYPPYPGPAGTPFVGPSSHDFPVDAPRRSSGTYIDPAELADIRNRADSMERERNRYRDLYHAATKEGKGKKKK